MVSNASFFGMGEGTARGGAPGARLAIYKACWFDLCSDADILAAMDDAIHDGVDIFSLSFGADPPQPIYFEDVVSIGTFHAFQKGVFISASAGNSFLPSTAANVAPWILTVAASTIDRDLHTYLQLGNSIVIKVVMKALQVLPFIDERIIYYPEYIDTNTHKSCLYRVSAQILQPWRGITV